MSAHPVELAPGLWRWTARHPSWHPPGAWGAEVASYALRAGDGHTLVVDPLLPPDGGPVWSLLDDLGGDRVTVAITIPYHVRDAEPVWRRARDRGADARIAGHPGAAKRLDDTAGFVAFTPGEDLGGATPVAIGKPRRNELPLHVPAHAALVFGDALVTTPEGELRIWENERPDADRVRWVTDVFAPTLAPLRDLDPQRILVTHGEPLLDGGRAALEDAMAAGPWYHRG